MGRSTACRARRRGWRLLSLFRLLASLALGTRRIPQIVGWLPLGWCFWLSCGKIGSSESKKSLHFGQNSNLVAQSGGLLRGGAQRQPRVFQGGDLRLPCLRHGFCLLRRQSRHALRRPLRDIMINGIQINRQNFYYLITQIAVSHNSGFA